MQKGLYSVRDVKTEAFSPPWQSFTHGEAIRQFSDLVRNQETLISRHPEDYALFHIGYFDDQLGVLVPLEQPIRLSMALEFVPSSGTLKAV